MGEQATTSFEPAPGVLAAVGNTPLVRLDRLFPEAGLELHAKMELLNPGGSIKDRPARAILLEAIRARQLRPGSMVIESSSGNLAIAIAQICAYFGVGFICVVDPKTTAQNVAILHAYGAEVDLVARPDPLTGEYLPARLARVHALLAEHPGAFWPNQYANLRNPLAHHQTMDEVVAALDGRVDYLFCATSTCGTLRGCAEYVRARGLDTRIVAVDAAGSAIFGGTPARRLLPGHGAAVRPALFQAGLADRVVHVTDRECVAGCRTLARREAILAGGSSGAVVAAAHHLLGEIPAGSRCALILADRGERYLDTVYSDTWVIANFGEVPPLLPGDAALAA